MTPASWFVGAQLAGALFLLLLGAVLVWTVANAVKRLAGLQIAALGVLVSLAALGAPPHLMLVAIGATVAQVALGVALVVRLQETYGGVETPEIDLADNASEADR